MRADSVSRDRFDVRRHNGYSWRNPACAQQQEMLQKLLADRFQLKFHHDKRELSVYAIQIGKGGPKLKPAANPDAEADQEGNGHGTEQTLPTPAPQWATLLWANSSSSTPTRRPNRTHGRYDFSIRYTYDEVHATDPNAPPGLFYRRAGAAWAEVRTRQSRDRRLRHRSHREAFAELACLRDARDAAVFQREVVATPDHGIRSEAPRPEAEAEEVAQRSSQMSRSTWPSRSRPTPTESATETRANTTRLSRVKLHRASRWRRN